MKLFGQNLSVIENQVLALILNVYSWIIDIICKILRITPKRTLPSTDEVCVMIDGPGGLDKLKYIDLPGCIATAGYNLPNIKSPFVSSSLPESVLYSPDCIIVKNRYFSVNYADVTIRWGLYESALQHVGWPIVPGFDFAGTVLWAGSQSGYQVGDEVFGFTLFGAYSSRILVPARQVRKVPSHVPLEVAAATPAVAGTALHAISLAGSYPTPLKARCKAALIHSAAGGVGSMLIQMCKLCGYSPVVAVVGASHKIDICRQLGADVVIDKSSQNLWSTARKAAPEGYAAIFDANGVESLRQSYEHLTRCGRLIIYGFHTNLPKASHFLSPLQWLKMAKDLITMPQFDAMPLVLESKGVLGFNLSFFADEHELIRDYMNQVTLWMEKKKIKMAEVTVFDMSEIHEAHKLIQSGQSVGKIVVRCPE